MFDLKFACIMNYEIDDKLICWIQERQEVYLRLIYFVFFFFIRFFLSYKYYYLNYNWT